MKAAPEGGAALLSGVYDRKTLADLVRDVPLTRLLYMTETIQRCAAALPDSIRQRTDAELCLLRLCDESLSGDLTALEARIQRLEEAQARGVVIRAAVEQSTAPPPTGKAQPKAAPKAAPAAEDVPPWEEPPLPEEP